MQLSCPSLEEYSVGFRRKQALTRESSVFLQGADRFYSLVSNDFYDGARFFVRLPLLSKNLSVCKLCLLGSATLRLSRTRVHLCVCYMVLRMFDETALCCTVTNATLVPFRAARLCLTYVLQRYADNFVVQWGLKGVP